MSGQKIVLGISGGIAAYKTPELVRLLKKRGAEVQAVLTRSAKEFVTETTLQAVSGAPVRENLWDKEAEAAMGHIELARWADLVLIAPATAEIMSRLALGAAPDLLTTLCLATEAPIVVAPAMNHIMWADSGVQDNCRVLKQRDIRILGPAVGDQACGESGPGRMVEPEDIVAAIMGPKAVPDVSALAGKVVMITAGPTREAIDPVRYISNRSSGKMGYAIAAAARDAGAKVLLVSGPVNIVPPGAVETIFTESAKEMFAAVHDRLTEVDVFIGAAAVADYHSASVQTHKLKKSESDLSLDLSRTPDILASVAGQQDRPFTVGFAAETQNLREYALGKLKEKNLDMIVANLVGANQGFEKDRNSVEVFWQDGEKVFPDSDKKVLGRQLVKIIGEQYKSIQDAQTVQIQPAISGGD